MKRESCKRYKLKDMNSGCALCEFYVACAKDLGKPYRTFAEKTTRINEFKEGCTEVVVYKKPFPVLDEYGNLEGQEIEKNFVRVNDHPLYGSYLIPRREEVRFQTLCETLDRSKKRALDRYYSYARANEWKYFFTFTFDQEKVRNRYDDDECRYCWQLFRQKMQRFDPNVKLLCVPEFHSDKGKGVAMHFHGFMDTIYDFTLRLYKDPKTGEQKYTKNGDPLFAFDFWEYGLATCAVLPAGKDSPKVFSYVQKYIVKSDGVGYCKRRYFATRNLSEKETRIVDATESAEYLSAHCLEVYKDNDQMTVYRSWANELKD